MHRSILLDRKCTRAKEKISTDLEEGYTIEYNNEAIRCPCCWNNRMNTMYIWPWPHAYFQSKAKHGSIDFQKRVCLRKLISWRLWPSMVAPFPAPLLFLSLTLPNNNLHTHWVKIHTAWKKCLNNKTLWSKLTIYEYTYCTCVTEHIVIAHDACPHVQISSVVGNNTLDEASALARNSATQMDSHKLRAERLNAKHRVTPTWDTRISDYHSTLQYQWKG